MIKTGSKKDRILEEYLSLCVGRRALEYKIDMHHYSYVLWMARMVMLADLFFLCWHIFSINCGLGIESMADGFRCLAIEISGFLLYRLIAGNNVLAPMYVRLFSIFIWQRVFFCWFFYHYDFALYFAAATVVCSSVAFILSFFPQGVDTTNIPVEDRLFRTDMSSWQYFLEKKMDVVYALIFIGFALWGCNYDVDKYYEMFTSGNFSEAYRLYKRDKQEELKYWWTFSDDSNDWIMQDGIIEFQGERCGRSIHSISEDRKVWNFEWDRKQGRNTVTTKHLSVLSLDSNNDFFYSDTLMFTLRDAIVKEYHFRYVSTLKDTVYSVPEQNVICRLLTVRILDDDNNYGRLSMLYGQNTLNIGAFICSCWAENEHKAEPALLKLCKTIRFKNTAAMSPVKKQGKRKS